MDGQDVIFGYGPVGRAIAARLTAAGRRVCVAQRSRPTSLPAEMAFVRCDVLDPTEVMAAASGASRIVIAIGFAYVTAVWKASWPRAMANLLAAAEATRAPTLFIDNMYAYGPQSTPIRETTPLASWVASPPSAVRSARCGRRLHGRAA